ncbi:hypothetical protein ACE1BU_05875 [Aeromonas veronii]|uniref:hypothetical protein n=1 Tax=Aeromonas veronii TaxID=654 RepID=UPI0035B9D17D
MFVYNYIVLKKNDEYLAVVVNQSTHMDINHYYDQGFTFFMNISAFNSQAAIQQAKQNATAEINILRSELNSLQQKYQKIKDDYDNLKFSNSFGFTSPNEFNPMEILGFKTMPTKQELKKQYKVISLKVHSDRGGSDWLMRVVNHAYAQLAQQIG